MSDEQKFKLSRKQITTILSVVTLFLGGETFIGAQIIESKIQDILRPEINPYFVGFFIDKTTKKLKFKHSDGDIYRPRFNQNLKRYFIVLDDGTIVFCY